MTSLWNGAGQVIRIDGQGRTGAQVWQDAVAAGATTITDADHDVHDEGLADTIQKTLNLDGENSPTTDISWGTNKITSLKAATARADAMNLGQAQDGAGTYVTAGGTADAITGSLTPAITAYATGMRIRIKIASNNTGATTANFNSVGAKNVHGVAGTALAGGELKANAIEVFVYDGTQFVIEGWSAALHQPLAPGSLFGCTLSRDAGDTDHDVNVTAGKARDGSDAVNLILASEITKQLDASWAVGDDAGGLDTGSIAADSSYAVWLIRRSDTGVVDVLLSLSATSPTMPTDYDQKRRVGWVITNSSSNLIAFFQDGDRFMLDVPIQDHTDGVGTTAELKALTVPPSTRPVLYVEGNTTGGDKALLLTGPEQTDTACGENNVRNMHVPAADEVKGGQIFDGTLKADSSSQIRVRANSATVTVSLVTQGWIDRRGKDA